jgi:hypothetical protein
MAEGVCGIAGEAVAIVGKGRGARHDAVCQVPPKPGEVVATVRDPCWQHPDLARDHSHGIVAGVSMFLAVPR